MISRPSQIMNAANAAKYFDDHLSSGDYYESSGKTPGVWCGKAAKALGLSGQVKREDFLALIDGKHPETGDFITQRENTTRKGGKEANRRCASDWCIAPPKSVSIAAEVHGDKRLIEAHNRAVMEAAKVLEGAAAVRVRSSKDPLNGKDRTTSNIAAAIFQHDTSRASKEGGIPDPQLHSHIVVMNLSEDVDGEFKALQNYEMLKIRKYADAIYEHSLIQSIHEMGYSIREKGKSWELAHISEETCQKFSKRREAILKKTAELVAKGAKRDKYDLQDAAAHDQRIRKDSTATADSLREGWRDQMSEAELNPTPVKRNYSIDHTAQDSIEWAKEHCFERNAVVLESEILVQALRHARGSSITEAQLKEAMEADDSFLRAEGGKITTREVLATERYSIDAVRDGRDQFEAFAPDGLLGSADCLDPVQRKAAETILACKDFAVVFKGPAGTGKSTTLEQIKPALEAAGKQVFVIAPQNKQVSDLKKAGFTNAMTLSRFNNSDEIALSHDTVLILDEAGQVGGKDMEAFLKRAKEAGSRVILSGDPGQHGAVAASDSLRAIVDFALPTIGEIVGEESIRRQKVGWYKSAVYAASQKRTSASMAILEAHGAIVPVESEFRAEEVAKLAVAKSGTSLVVTQTNSEVKVLNAAIRAELIKTGRLDSSTEIQVPIYSAKEVGSSAEKQMASSYDASTRIMVNRQCGEGLKPGMVGQFVREGEKGAIVMSVEGQEFTVPAISMDRLTLVSEETIPLCVGDRIQLKANCKLDKDTRLDNGSLYNFVGLDPKGNILCSPLDDPKTVYTLKDGFRQIRHGYSLTSYSSQGATVDHVIISDSASKMATSVKQFYVSISRGRESVTILTSDKEKLKEHIAQLGDRELASELKLLPTKKMALEKERAEMDSVKKHGPFKDSRKIDPALPSPEITQRIRSFLHTIPSYFKSFFSRAGQAFERGSGFIASLVRTREKSATIQKQRESEHEIEM